MAAFEALEIAFTPDPQTQQELIAGLSKPAPGKGKVMHWTSRANEIAHNAIDGRGTRFCLRSLGPDGSLLRCHSTVECANLANSAADRHCR